MGFRDGSTSVRSTNADLGWPTHNKERLMSGAHDVVIVGGGIAGSALAIVLAKEGIAVAVLERDLASVDRVRGEWMAPWGAAELKRLGLRRRSLVTNPERRRLARV